MKKERLAQTAKPSAAANGFALSPIAPLSWAAVVGMSKPGGEAVIRGRASLSSPSVLLVETPQSDQGSIASALKTIYGHKRKPRQGTFVGASGHHQGNDDSE